MTFGQKIQKLRKEAGISQEELSFQLNVSRQAISKWENDNGYPETEKIVRMSKIFGVTLDYLLNDSEDSKEKVQVEESGMYVSREMANGFLMYQASKYKKVALALAILIGGTAFGFAPEIVGTTAYLIILIASITLLVYVIITDNPYRKIWREELLLDKDYKEELENIYMEKRKKYNLIILFSVILFCVGFMIIPFAGIVFMESETGQSIILAVGMVLGGIAVYLFIYLFWILRSYKVIAKNEEYRGRRK